MLQQIISWLFVSLIILWILLVPIKSMLHALWEIFIEIYDRKLINLPVTFGEWAVVTGSTDGIGKAYAKELAARDMNLILISRNLEKLEKTKKEILEINSKVKIKLIAADFSEGKEAFNKIRPELEGMPIGILVNNVGIMYDYPMYLGEVPEEKLWDLITVNVGATTLMTRLVIKQMQARKRGAIVNVSSGSEFQPLPLMTVYAASKMYMKSFSDAVRAEYSRFGITVQHLSPFFITTKMNAYSHRLQVSSVLIPDATSYARSAVATLGKTDTNTGYWSHSIQKFILLIFPMWIRIKVGLILNNNFRQDYFKQEQEKESQ
ncbi:inactive hydroxysteroid dehydrogenase-like protein 1 [Ooceraea biroi]|uniref:Inactive hydroxysteroid dehydrogenase-like protein n=2 Tax=Ooceraea biroi TaxID=2015173 RepID=A0A026VVA5_OOCBI|nr:inactive hydroxysteroid dehydrogenase-like protein 1 [Ooceraea biroi]XP_011349767.1 inactive hydroxysteroid dehydrogenase-like protein 1 [Ooceraea biroi]XP_026825356.1 inactive hydroxysteroid dehydrogenase-like protein 1 [Ooceraea biroi]EZA47466.1 Inactive hydroxysteroid dehydrogenase-like protein [Ooceraea biroi]